MCSFILSEFAQCYSPNSSLCSGKQKDNKYSVAEYLNIICFSADLITFHNTSNQVTLSVRQFLKSCLFAVPVLDSGCFGWVGELAVFVFFWILIILMFTNEF